VVNFTAKRSGKSIGPSKMMVAPVTDMLDRDRCVPWYGGSDGPERPDKYGEEAATGPQRTSPPTEAA
jgi:hypothetical protein